MVDDATQALHDLAITNVKLGQYDTALSQYMKALEAYRAAGDKSGIATESSDMGACLPLKVATMPRLNRSRKRQYLISSWTTTLI